MLPSVLDFLCKDFFPQQQTPGLVQLAIVMQSAAGLVLSTIRLTDPIVLSELRKALGARRSSLIELVSPSQLLPEPSDWSGQDPEPQQDFFYNCFFEDAVSETLLSTLASICLTLTHLAPSEQSVQFDRLAAWNLFNYKQVNTWEISPDDVKELSPQFSNSFTEPVRITEYAPVIFAHLRHLDHISNEELAE
jgi:hypothetical protein